jgi:hypothetical protein
VYQSQLIAKREHLRPSTNGCNGVWREEIQVLKVDGVKERWIDLSEVAKWARQNRQNFRAA